MPLLRLNSDGTLRAEGTRAKQPAHRRTRADVLRSTARWQRLRVQQVTREPWCALCGTTRDLTADHITPLARGGELDGPLRTLCRGCNSAEGVKARRPRRARRDGKGGRSL